MQDTSFKVHPTDPIVAKHVHDDIWDLFGTLTREQSQSLISYLESLTRSGILLMPQANSGELAEVEPENPYLTEDKLNSEAISRATDPTLDR